MEDSFDSYSMCFIELTVYADGGLSILDAESRNESQLCAWKYN